MGNFFKNGPNILKLIPCWNSPYNKYGPWTYFTSKLFLLDEFHIRPDCMVVGFTTTYAISAYHLYRSQTNYIEYNSQWVGFELTTLVVIGTDCIGSCKSNYHTIRPDVYCVCKRYIESSKLNPDEPISYPNIPVIIRLDNSVINYSFR
jgi:hypothetical protein